MSPMKQQYNLTIYSPFQNIPCLKVSRNCGTPIFTIFRVEIDVFRQSKKNLAMLDSPIPPLYHP